jgi:hypothetical protein
MDKAHSLNIDKCKKLSFGRNVANVYKYYINNVELENTNVVKDLGVIYNSDLKFKIQKSTRHIAY